MSGDSSSSSTVCDRRQVRLTRYGQETFIDNYTTGYRLKVVASEACLMDVEIFRWFRGDPDLRGNSYDEFSGVCSSYEMESLPVEEPSDSDCPKQYRTAEFDIILPSQTLSQLVWEEIVKEVNTLVATLGYSESLVVLEHVDIGV